MRRRTGFAGAVLLAAAAAAALVFLALAPTGGRGAPSTRDGSAAVGASDRSHPVTGVEPERYPDRGEVGVRDETILDVIEPPNGVLTITEDVYELANAKVIGGIDFTGRRLSLDNVVVEGGHGFWGLVVVRGAGATVEVTDSTIRSVRPLPDADGILPLDGGTIIARRVDISGGADGLKPGDGSLVEDSWIHDLAAVADAHNDGIHIMGGRGITIRRNRIEVNQPGAFDAVHQNAAIFAQPYGRGAVIDDLVIEDNFLMGGGYALRLEGATTGVSVTGNVFGPPATTVDWSGEYLVEPTVDIEHWVANIRGDEHGAPLPARDILQLGGNSGG